MNVVVVGCGLSGVTAAVALKDKGCNVKIFETRKHIGGNCYDGLICNTLVHHYGPHIFHTNDEEVFSFLSRFTEWTPFSYKPKGATEIGKISLPYSKKTISEIGRELSAEEIEKYIFKDYSEKQWGVSFEDIPKSITKRIPDTCELEDPTWFKNDKYQCIPKNGYTEMFKNMISGLDVKLNCAKEEWKKEDYDLVIYTGKIDEYYNYTYGRLPYRSLIFKHEVSDKKMPYLVENQNTKRTKYTRKYDHSYFSEHNDPMTVITKEYPVEHSETNTPFYPLPFKEPNELYKKYKTLAKQEKNTIFIGRLATYKYLDMWMAVKQSLQKIEKYLNDNLHSN